MGERNRDRLELRTIVVSYRSGLRYTPAEQREALRARALELLARLEGRLRRDGTDPTMLEAIERERRAL